MHLHSALAILEPQIYVGVEQFGAEKISLLSERLVEDSLSNTKNVLNFGKNLSLLHGAKLLMIPFAIVPKYAANIKTDPTGEPVYHALPGLQNIYPLLLTVVASYISNGIYFGALHFLKYLLW